MFDEAKFRQTLLTWTVSVFQVSPQPHPLARQQHVNNLLRPVQGAAVRVQTAMLSLSVLPEYADLTCPGLTYISHVFAHAGHQGCRH